MRRESEDNATALDRYLSEIKHPLVGHRLVLFRRLLAQLRNQFGMPDMIVIEAVRSLALASEGRVQRGVDFGGLGAEELGSIYESLLELHRKKGVAFHSENPPCKYHLNRYSLLMQRQ